MGGHAREVKQVVLADAGPLIALARIGQLQLLPALFGEVAITQQVAAELVGGGSFPDSADLQKALGQAWLKTVDLESGPKLAKGTDSMAQCRDLMNLHQIDLGEASALVYAAQCQSKGNAALLVMDDFRGRVAAKVEGVAVLGTAGLLLLAKQTRLINAVNPLLVALRQNGYFLSDRLIDATLEQAGEV